MEFRIEHFSLVDSTNMLVKKALEEGEPEGYGVAARRQTGGYGRQGRRWESPAGGLYLSLALYPTVSMEALPTLSLVAALAVRKALDSFVPGDRLFVKWPNDIVVTDEPVMPLDDRESSRGWENHGGRENSAGFSKLCGISLESHSGGICLGIGVNVFMPEKALSCRSSIIERSSNTSGASSLENVATFGEAILFANGAPNRKSSQFARSISLEQIDSTQEAQKFRPAYLEQFLAFASANRSINDESAICESVLNDVETRILGTFDEFYRQWQAEGFVSFVKTFNSENILLNREISVYDINGRLRLQGRAGQIDNFGRLSIIDKGGNIHWVSSGEVHLGL